MSASDLAFSATAPPRKSRWLHLVFPREHGAWGMMLVPLLTGGVIGLRSGHGVSPLIALLVCSLALFCARTPFESLTGASPFRARTASERRLAGIAGGGYLALALPSLGLLLRETSPVIVFGLGAAAAAGFAGQYLVRRTRPRDRCLAQLIGSAGLTATAAAAFYVAAGRWTATALLIWAANWLFVANQIHYVQLRIHAANTASRLQKVERGLHFLFGEIVLASVLIAAAEVGALPWVACLAYLPVLVRGTVWFFEAPSPLAIHRLGLTEMAHAVAFGVLLVACV